MNPTFISVRGKVYTFQPCSLAPSAVTQIVTTWPRQAACGTALPLFLPLRLGKHSSQLGGVIAIGGRYCIRCQFLSHPDDLLCPGPSLPPRGLVLPLDWPSSETAPQMAGLVLAGCRTGKAVAVAVAVACSRPGEAQQLQPWRASRASLSPATMYYLLLSNT